MSREAAERIEKLRKLYDAAKLYRSGTWDYYFIAREIVPLVGSVLDDLALLTPVEDDERIAREIVMSWIMTVDCDGHSDEERESLVKSFAQALAAKGAP